MQAHPHVTCICFLGGDADHQYLANLIQNIKSIYKSVKIAIYSGFQEYDHTLGQVVDYYKMGPYRPECGPLNIKTTNQYMLKKHPAGYWENITYKFQKERD